jgi:capsular exopolysaccharide synthesis family protein
MSRMFDALRKAKGEAARIGMQMISEAGAGQAGGDSGRMSTAAVATESAVATVETQIRTLPIRIQMGSAVLPFDGSDKRASEQYRMVRTRIVQHPNRPRVMVVSSPSPGDGKTISSLNIAGALALRSDVNVLLVDADLRRSNVAAWLSLPESPGLAEVLAGTCALEDAIIRVEQFPNLYLLTSGRPLSNPGELLDSPSWKRVVDSFRENFSYVFVDAPPIGAVADYDLIHAVCDGVVLVVRPDHTDRSLCERALSLVPQEDLIGVVMNCVQDWPLFHSNSYYYYAAEK